MPSLQQSQPQKTSRCQNHGYSLVWPQGPSGRLEFKILGLATPFRDVARRHTENLRVRPLRISRGDEERNRLVEAEIIHLERLQVSVRRYDRGSELRGVRPVAVGEVDVRQLFDRAESVGKVRG